MRPTTRLDHERRIAEAVDYVVNHLDDTLDPRDLADRVCLSRFHFHRVFQALMGETAVDLVRRLRLERAAQTLYQSVTPITEIAFDSGYATHEAFTRAFRAAYGTAPSAFRRERSHLGPLPTPNHLHYGSPDYQFAAKPGEINMNVDIRESQALRAVCMTHHGAYHEIGATFGRLVGWIHGHQVPMNMTIAFYYDDPAITPVEALTSDAGVLVSPEFITDDPSVHVVEVPAGRYAVATHLGPYSGLGEAWGKFHGQWFPSSGHEFGEGAPFELYLNDCDQVPPEEVRTELWIPIR